jgi:hypothetical protein
VGRAYKDDFPVVGSRNSVNVRIFANNGRKNRKKGGGVCEKSLKMQKKGKKRIFQKKMCIFERVNVFRRKIL